jgi:hypothetical protein
MTKRELTLGILALLMGFGGLLGGWMLLFRPKPTPAKVVAPVAGDDTDDASQADVPVDTAPLPTAAPDVPDAPVSRDSGAASRDARSDAPPIVVRAANLLIHPFGKERECVDAQSHGVHGLQLFRCHGRGNQRWTFAEDITGASRIFGSEGGCVQIGDDQGGDPSLVLGPCGSDSSRFRHLADKRLQDVRSGKCVTSRSLEKHARLVLETCDPANAGQGWTFSP